VADFALSLLSRKGSTRLSLPRKSFSRSGNAIEKFCAANDKSPNNYFTIKANIGGGKAKAGEGWCSKAAAGLQGQSINKRSSSCCCCQLKLGWMMKRYKLFVCF
jgi:hypothetical protein